MTAHVSDAELSDQTRRRDAQSVRQLAVDFTDAAAWLDSLLHDQGVLDAPDVWLSITGWPATLQQISGRWVPGPDRVSPSYSLRAVHAAYRTGGVLMQLSHICGVAWAGMGAAPTDVVRLTTEATAKQINETRHKIERALSPLQKAGIVHVRTSGAMVLHELDEAWQAQEGQTIEGFPATVCAVCGVALHWANEHWRDENAAFEVDDEVPCASCDGTGERVSSGRVARCVICMGRGTKKVLNHEHSIEVPA